VGQCSCQSTRIDQNNFLDLGDAFCVLTAIAIRSSPQGEGWRQPPAVRFPEVKAPSGVAPPLWIWDSAAPTNRVLRRGSCDQELSWSPKWCPNLTQCPPHLVLSVRGTVSAHSLVGQIHAMAWMGPSDICLVQTSVRARPKTHFFKRLECARRLTFGCGPESHWALSSSCEPAQWRAR